VARLIDLSADHAIATFAGHRSTSFGTGTARVVDPLDGVAGGMGQTHGQTTTQDPYRLRRLPRPLEKGLLTQQTARHAAYPA
jgi:hypothetical protein